MLSKGRSPMRVYIVKPYGRFHGKINGRSFAGVIKQGSETREKLQWSRSVQGHQPPSLQSTWRRSFIKPWPTSDGRWSIVYCIFHSAMKGARKLPPEHLVSKTHQISTSQDMEKERSQHLTPYTFQGSNQIVPGC